MNVWHKDLFGMLLVVAVINFIVRCPMSPVYIHNYSIHFMTNDKDHE
jgi:hypothetical protein